MSIHYILKIIASQNLIIFAIEVHEIITLHLDVATHFMIIECIIALFYCKIPIFECLLFCLF